MIAKELISIHIPSISFKDDGEKALRVMDENRVSHIAVVDNGEYHGLISDNEIYDLDDTFVPLDQVKPVLIKLFVQPFDHIYDILTVFAENNITALPVLNEDDQYLGVIGLEQIIKAPSQNDKFERTRGSYCYGFKCSRLFNGSGCANC